MILDCIGGSSWEQNVTCLATDGRWVLYGTMGGRTVQGDLLGKLLSKRGHLLCSLLRSRSLQVRRNPDTSATCARYLSGLDTNRSGFFQYKADLVKAFSLRVLPYFSEQPIALRPVIDRTFSLEDIAEAHRHMEANRNMGKIVINVIPPNQQ